MQLLGHTLGSVEAAAVLNQWEKEVDRARGGEEGEELPRGRYSDHVAQDTWGEGEGGGGRERGRGRGEGEGEGEGEGDRRGEASGGSPCSYPPLYTERYVAWSSDCCWPVPESLPSRVSSRRRHSVRLAEKKERQ